MLVKKRDFKDNTPTTVHTFVLIKKVDMSDGI